MKCIKCGNELVENAQFCTNCGAVQEQPSQPVNPVYQQAVPGTVIPNQVPMVSVPQKKKADISFVIKLFVNVMGILSGIASIIMGIVISCKDCGDYAITESYGGDAYTGIQNAAAEAANNVLASNRIISDGLCFVCVSIGLAVIFCFASKLLDTILTKKEENKL